MAKRQQLPRSIRNNNPLNIRRSSQRWLGKVTSSVSCPAACPSGWLDPNFEVFENIDYGIRAAFCIIRSYIKKYNITTVEGIIARWAPRSENPLASYVRFVCQKAQLVPTQNVRFDQITTITRLAWAMHIFECGKEYISWLQFYCVYHKFFPAPEYPLK